MKRRENSVPDNAAVMNLPEAEAVLGELARVFRPSGSEAPGIAREIQQRTLGNIEPGQPSIVEARYRILVEQIPAVVFMIDLDRPVGEGYVSPQVETLLGFSQADWLEDPVRLYGQIHLEDKERWSVEAANLFVSGAPLRSMYRVIARDGRVVWFQCQAKLVRRESGQPWFIHGVGFDITELKRAEEELQKANDTLETRVRERTVELARINDELQKAKDEIHKLNQDLERRVKERTEQLQEANKQLEAFSYSVAHDLRSPLRAIEGFSQVVEEDYGQKLDDAGRVHLRRVRAAAQHMAQLIDDMLKLSRLSRVEMRRETVNLSAIATSIAEDLIQSEPDREVDFDIAEGLFAEGDEGLLWAALDNLLRNAWKFTSKLERSHIAVGTKGSENGRQVYFVLDNGAGFNMAYADKLFKPFQRLHSTAEFSGTGIGLALVQRIIHRHGGRVWAEAQPGNGATFYFTL
jgi:PAS domain S-box-containing protein